MSHAPTSSHFFFSSLARRVRKPQICVASKRPSSDACRQKAARIRARARFDFRSRSAASPASLVTSGRIPAQRGAIHRRKAEFDLKARNDNNSSLRSRSARAGTVRESLLTINGFSKVPESPGNITPASVESPHNGDFTETLGIKLECQVEGLEASVDGIAKANSEFSPQKSEVPAQIIFGLLPRTGPYENPVRIFQLHQTWLKRKLTQTYDRGNPASEASVRSKDCLRLQTRSKKECLLLGVCHIFLRTYQDDVKIDILAVNHWRARQNTGVKHRSAFVDEFVDTFPETRAETGLGTRPGID
ncbi:hypothetical protein DFH11DRAFT_1542298 [Phellopilus nigrolimitatus]|nr:hypothetical protein DFH11DRAFT_1542298 [Phellopilus nigrolimitatus]